MRFIRSRRFFAFSRYGYLYVSFLAIRGFFLVGHEIYYASNVPSTFGLIFIFSWYHTATYNLPVMFCYFRYNTSVRVIGVIFYCYYFSRKFVYSFCYLIVFTTFPYTEKSNSFTANV